MTSIIYPDAGWARIAPAEAGLDPEKLHGAQRWLDRAAARGRDKRYRVVIVRRGRIAAEWNHGFAQDKQLGLASAASSSPTPPVI